MVKEAKFVEQNEHLCAKLFTLSQPLLAPDVILCGWLGSKHQLTNYLALNHYNKKELKKKKTTLSYTNRDYWM